MPGLGIPAQLEGGCGCSQEGVREPRQGVFSSPDAQFFTRCEVLCGDAETAEAPDMDAMEYAQAIIDQTGANYLHVIPGDGMFYGVLGNITAVPTTYFVDENGNQIGEEYVGSRDYDGWAGIVDELLASIE